MCGRGAGAEGGGALRGEGEGAAPSKSRELRRGRGGVRGVGRRGGAPLLSMHTLSRSSSCP